VHSASILQCFVSLNNNFFPINSLFLGQDPSWYSFLVGTISTGFKSFLKIKVNDEDQRREFEKELKLKRLKLTEKHYKEVMRNGNIPWFFCIL
jgi:hypothetical protein